MLIDFLVVAPLEEEIRGLSSALGADDAKRYYEGQLTYFDKLVTSPNDRRVHVRVLKLSDSGTLNAAVQTLPLIVRWRPRCVVSFGIAGGFLEHVAYGDVVVAKDVWYYEPAKEAVDDKSGLPVHKNRPILFRCDQALIDSFWTTVAPSPVLPREGTVRYGPLASGEKLIAAVDSSSRNAIDMCHEKMLGVEMEAAGVAGAVQQCANTGCRLLVIKGVSDDAGSQMGSGKSDDRRQQRRDDAIANASEVLKPLVTNVDPGQHERPSVNPVHLRKLGAQFRECIPANLLPDFNEEHLRRALHGSKPRPTVFYHWTVLHEHMHWVDMCFLLLLCKFRTIGYPVHALITDNENRCHKNGVPAAVTVTSVLLGPDTPVTRKSQVWDIKHEFYRFAAAQGWRDYTPLPDAQSLEGLDFWPPFIAYCAQADERCIVLIWHRFAAAYERLRDIVWLEPVIVRTADILLGEELGKFGSPGKDIVIDPPLYGSILEWLESLPSIETLRAFTEYLGVGFSDDELSSQSLCDNGSRMLRDRTGTLAVLKDNGSDDPARFACIRRLLSILLEWNHLYFNQRL